MNVERSSVVSASRSDLCDSCGSPGAIGERCWACSEEERRQRADEAVILEQIRQSGIPVRYEEMTKDEAKLEAIINSERGLYLFGKQGRGKTVLVSQAGLAFIRAGRGAARFLTAVRFILEVQSRYQSGDALKFVTELAEAPLLILDDLGKEKWTDDARNNIFHLLSEREAWGRRTYLTSNFSLDEIDQRVDPSLSSRIAGMCDVREMQGPDRRLEL